MGDKRMLMLTFVAYWAIIMFFTFGCTMYAVFVLGHSPYWMFFTLSAGFGYSPNKWYSLMDGVNRPNSYSEPQK